jgi:hypothetical protein
LAVRVTGTVVVGFVLLTLTAGATRGLAVDTPPRPPPGTIAVVSKVPLSLGRITSREFHRALVQTAAADGFRRPPDPQSKKFKGLEHIALTSSLEMVWTEGQAAAMGISFSPQEVSRNVDWIKRHNFHSEAEYRKFLREARYTPRDVNERVRLQMLAGAILERVEKGRHPHKALDDFIHLFRSRWRARTVCAKGYIASKYCSNGASLTPSR